MKIPNEQIYEILEASLEKFHPYIDDLNKFNYFPVADYDTGTNMYETLKGTIKNSNYLSDIPKISPIYSKGNSGIIFSQILCGFITSVLQTDGINGFSDIIKGLKLSCEYAYNSILYPKEGTMLTFIRILSEITSAHDIKSDLDKALMACIKNETIDAGAKGLYYYFCAVSKCEPNAELLSRYSKERDMVERPINKYCTEFVINTDTHICKEELANMIEPFGDSINMVILEHSVKIHIHTGDPFKIFSLFPGLIQWYKIDNMALSQTKSTFAVIIDLSKDEDVFKDVECEYIITSETDVSTLDYKLKSINYTDTFILITDYPERFQGPYHNVYIVTSRGYQSRYAACLCINNWMSFGNLIENMELSIETCNT